MVRKQRETQRGVREKTGMPHAAIVGYTNAGKSTLLNRLNRISGATKDKEGGGEVLEADMLFATLDPTTRRVELSDGQPLLLTDTVGFVRNLPHRLVESFKATLEEAVLADFLIHVVDASAPEARVFYETTMDVLEELGAGEQKMLLVFNKIDLVEDPMVIESLRGDFPEALFVSAIEKRGFEELEKRCMLMLADRISRGVFRIPQSRGDLLSLIHAEGKVLNTEYEGNEVVVTATLSPALFGKLKEFDENRDENEGKEDWM